MLDKILDVIVIIDIGRICGRLRRIHRSPKKGKDIVFHFARALRVVWALAVFVSPAVSERFQLSKSESVALLIGGYCGIRLMSTAEKFSIENSLKPKE